MTFQDLNIVEPILKSLKIEGYTHPTPIVVKNQRPKTKIDEK